MRVVPEAVAQRGEMRLDRATPRPGGVPPHLAQQLGSRDDPAAMPNERGEEVELLGPKGQRLRAAAHDARCEVDVELAEPQRRARFGCARAPLEQRLDAREEFAQPARLHDVVVGAEVEAAQLLLLGAAGRHDQHRRLASFVAQSLQHAVAVHGGQHEVEHDEVRLVRLGVGETGSARGRDGDLVPLPFEIARQGGGVVVVVFDEQNAAHATLDVSGVRAGSVAARSSITARVPVGDPSSSHASPPQLRATWRTTASPRPEPVRSDV